ncbi:hypothetical protein Cgig2_006185 [Carnegiea gigantea]|uniref:BHLH domain-containing protein n=1 Tax=Carnegiea gigantea TaxID=171969 RepID=A0A9Q1L0F4_9CARY|nr:hypothetical protein Cgig2_006185 [Carnegiea gigantea]
MDPPLIGEGSFSTASPSLSEIWPFNSGGDSGGMLGLRMGGAAGYGSGLIDALVNNNGGSSLINRDGSIEESTVTEQSGSFGGSGRKRRENCSGDESSKLVSSTSSANELARREKISERMKILQDLVPGCNKVIGKAVVLDEIINYIQSLQRQVEFLSMKLEAVNSGMIPSINAFHPKDVNQLGVPPFDASGMMYGAQVAREFAAVGPQSEWLHMQLGGSFDRST